MPCRDVPQSQQLSLFTHTLSAGSAMGHLNHLWSFGGTSPAQEGMQTYHIYIDGEESPSVEFEMRQAVGMTFDPASIEQQQVPVNAPGNATTQHYKLVPASAPTPWGTEWFGKGSDLEGYYNNFKVPFQKSIEIKVSLPDSAYAGGHKPMCVWTIVRGVENVPIRVGGYELPPSARMHTHRNDAITVADLHFTPLVVSVSERCRR